MQSTESKLSKLPETDRNLKKADDMVAGGSAVAIIGGLVALIGGILTFFPHLIFTGGVMALVGGGFLTLLGAAIALSSIDYRHKVY